MPFVDASKIDLPQRAIIAVEGLRGVGKSEFGLWGRAPVAYMRFDCASEGALRKIRDKRPGAIQVSTFEFDRPQAPKSGTKVLEFDDEVIEKAQEIYSAFLVDYHFAINNGFKTIVLDDAATIWELLRIVSFKKVQQIPQQKYDMLNFNFKRLLKEPEAAGINLIAIHPLKEEWLDVNDSDGKKVTSRKTGIFKPTGFSKMEYVAHSIIRFFRAGDQTDPAKTAIGHPEWGRFRAQLQKANNAGQLVGTVIDFAKEAEAWGTDNTFGIVMSYLFDGTMPEDWL